MPKVNNKYQRLRRVLHERDISQDYLGELLGRSGAYISRCFSGRSQWQINEVWAIVKLCQIEPVDICKYFPQDGMDVEYETKPDFTSQFATDLAELLKGYIKEAAGV